MQNLTLNEILDIYFTKDISDNNNYDTLIITKIKPIFKRNIISFLNDFIYQLSIDDFNSIYKRLFVNVHYKNIDENKYKSFIITSAIKDLCQPNDKYPVNNLLPLLSKQIKINNVNVINTYDIYMLAYMSIYNYFYEYLKNYVLLDVNKCKIYKKLVTLTNKLLDSFDESKFLYNYLYIFINTKYLLVHYYSEDKNNINGYTVLQSYDLLKDAIHHLDQYIEFNYKALPHDIYYDNLIYSKNNTNIAIILSKQDFNTLL